MLQVVVACAKEGGKQNMASVGLKESHSGLGAHVQVVAVYSHAPRKRRRLSLYFRIITLAAYSDQSGERFVDRKA